jgi:hypothetical protein
MERFKWSVPSNRSKLSRINYQPARSQNQSSPHQEANLDKKYGVQTPPELRRVRARGYRYRFHHLGYLGFVARQRLLVLPYKLFQENEEVDGKIIQHPHYMYSAATQRALARYLEPYGFRFGSLIWPLYSVQVQQLLWARYNDLCDLQYSCWRVEEGQATCSCCDQCMRIAMTAVAAGHNPERMGINLSRVMSYAPEWDPIKPRSSSIPQMRVGQRLRDNVVGAIKGTSTVQFAITGLSATPLRLLSWDTWKMFASYRRLRNRVRGLPDPPKLGVREAFLDWLEPELRERLIHIYTAYFPLEQKHHHLKVFQRSHILTQRATSTLKSVCAGAWIETCRN